MKRRNFITLASLSGLSWVLSSKYVSSQGAETKQEGENSSPLFSFVALADTGTGNRGQYAVAAAMNRYFEQHPFSLVLLAGDNIYPNGEIAKIGGVFESPYRFLRQRDVPFYAVLGNHDIRSQNGEAQIRYPGLNMQGRYYTFTQNSVQFFALDTNKEAPWEEQLTWLEEKLKRSPATGKIVFGHHPVFSAGLHGNTSRLVETLPPLFSRYGVQLYLCGGDHNYERTKIIDGTTYVVCGAGAKTRPVWKSKLTAYAKAKLSFAAFNVYPEQIEILGIGTNNLVFDRKIIPLG